MTIEATHIGTLYPRLYSCEYAPPGKWTCIIELDDFKGTFPNVDTKLLPSVGGKWVLTRKEKVHQEAHIGTHHYTYECSVTTPLSHQGDMRNPDVKKYVVSASVTLTRQPIGMHKNFAAIKQKYGGRLLYGEWDWPSQDPSGTSTRSATDKNGNKVLNVNPMYGVQEYLTPSITLRTSEMALTAYATPTLSSNLGLIDDPPSAVARLIGYNGVASKTSSGAADYGDWLLTENSVSQHGQDLQITKGWQSGQWNKILYTAASNIKDSGAG